MTPVTRPGANPGEIDLTFVISEGTRYSVRNVIIEGNSKIKTEMLMDDLELHSGKPFLVAVRDADKNRMLIKYDEIGCIDARSASSRGSPAQPGVVDLVYKIEEGEPYLLGELEIEGNERTKDKVIRREAVQAGLLPGEILDKNRIEIFKRRLTVLGYFANDPQKQEQADQDRDRRIERPPGPALRRPDDPADRRGDAGADARPGRRRRPGGRRDRAATRCRCRRRCPAAPAAPGLPGFDQNPFSPPPDTPPLDALPPIDVPVPPAGRPRAGLVGPGGPVGPPPGQPPVGAGEPPGSFPSIPGMNMTDVGPDRNDPFPNRSFADIVTSVEEAPTGRFMIGVGANSFQGLMGSITIYREELRHLQSPDRLQRHRQRQGVPRRRPGVSDQPPGGHPDQLDAGQPARAVPLRPADRGGGRRLPVPAYLSQLGRAARRRPVLARPPVRHQDLRRRRRPGPRRSTSSAIGRRPRPITWRPAASPRCSRSSRASGSTTATTRSCPPRGSTFNFSVEQGFGSFTWTKFDAEGRMYIPTFSRPDGTGKQFFTLRGHFGIATESTPVYERYFAGNFGSLRGFQYRTVSPHAFDVPTGGVMMAVGSVEYQFPWNARDTFNQIIFTDFGTVTGNYEFNDMRVSVGTGLKVSLPDVRPHAVRVRPGVPGPARLRRQVPVLQLHRQRDLLSGPGRLEVPGPGSPDRLVPPGERAGTASGSSRRRATSWPCFRLKTYSVLPCRTSMSCVDVDTRGFSSPSRCRTPQVPVCSLKA